VSLTAGAGAVQFAGAGAGDATCRVEAVEGPDHALTGSCGGGVGSGKKEGGEVAVVLLLLLVLLLLFWETVGLFAPFALSMVTGEGESLWSFPLLNPLP